MPEKACYIKAIFFDVFDSILEELRGIRAGISDFGG